MIELYFANPGAGKTTLAAAIIQKERKRILAGKSQYTEIFCNAAIHGAIYLDIPKILKTHAIKNSLIVIDEASIVYNNRLMKMSSQEIEFFKLHRHYGCDIILISQSFDDVDITLRRMYDKLFILRKMPFHLSMIKRIRKFITIDSESQQIVEGYEYSGFPRFMIRSKWYKFFNSYWVPAHIPVFKHDNLVPLDIVQTKKEKVSRKA